MGVTGSAPGGRGQVRQLTTRAGVASVTLLAAASLAVGGCASSTRNAGAPDCTTKHAAASAAGSGPGGSASTGVAASWTLPGGNLQNTRDVASAITASDVAHLGVAWCVPVESTGDAGSAGVTDGYSTRHVAVVPFSNQRLAFLRVEFARPHHPKYSTCDWCVP